MKIIDSLNNIANNKIYENPNKIKYEGQIWLKQASGDYIDSENSSRYLFDDYICFGFETLNDEVEIIEEDKKIKRIEERASGWWPNSADGNVMTLKQAVNELIDEVNKLKGDKNEK